MPGRPRLVLVSTVVALAIPFGVALWLRAIFFRAFPDPFATPDTWSYLTGTYGLLLKGQLDLFSMRTPALSLFVWTLLAPFGRFSAVTIAQGALTLGSGLFVVWVVRAARGPWRVAAILGGAFLVLHPHLLFWEHFLMTEGLYSAGLVFALGAAALALDRPTPGTAVLAATLASITVLIRPQGLFLPPLIAVALLWVARGGDRRKLLRIGAAAAAVPVLLLGGWSARNAVVHGFFGLTDISDLVTFGVAARWVDLERPTYVEAKRAIRAQIQRYQSMPDNVNWVQYAADGPAAAILKLHGGDPLAVNRTLAALSREAILAHPREVLGRGLATTTKMLSGRPDRSGCDFACASAWDVHWAALQKHFPVDRHRNQMDARSTGWRARLYNRHVRPWFRFESPFILASLLGTGFGLAALPILRGPRRLAVALSAVTVVLLVITAGFLSEPAERYVAIVHGAAALAFALALPGVCERLGSALRRLPSGSVPAGTTPEILPVARTTLRSRARRKGTAR